MSNQTAVEWLGTTLNKRLPPLDWDASAIIYKTVQKALKMEKEQIEDAFDVGYEASEYGNLLNKGEQYYQQTYGGDHE